MFARPTAEQRFDRLVDRAGPRPDDAALEGCCHVWTGTLAPNGCGRFKIAARAEVRAHLFSWTLARGPIRTGQQLINRCGRRSCVNPSHYGIGDAADRALVAASTGARRAAASVRADKRTGRRLTPAQVWAIRTMYATTDATQYQVARAFSCQQSTVSLIINGKLHGGLIEPVAPVAVIAEVVPIAAAPAPRSISPARPQALPGRALSYPPIR